MTNNIGKITVITNIAQIVVQERGVAFLSFK